MSLYTKNGRPLQVVGEMVYSRAGLVIGRIHGDRVHGANGHYVGAIVGDRLVHRSTDAASLGGTFVTSSRAASAGPNVPASAIWGVEPKTPD